MLKDIWASSRVVKPSTSRSGSSTALWMELNHRAKVPQPCKAISRLLGGGTQMMLGDLIEQQFLGGAYNPQLGAAISLVMMVIVVVCMVVMNRFGEGEEQHRDAVDRVQRRPGPPPEAVKADGGEGPRHSGDGGCQLGSRALMALVFLFLYAPIFLLIVFSFNKGNSNIVWTGFSLDWYKSLFQNRLIRWRRRGRRPW